MSKTLTGFRLPHCLAPVVGGGGYLVTGLFGVNRAFQLLRQIQEPLGLGRKNHFGPPRGFPLKSVAIRLELGTILISRPTSSAFLAPAVSLEVVRGPSGRRVSIRGGPGRQQRLQNNLTAEARSPRRDPPCPGSDGCAAAEQGPTRSREAPCFAAAHLAMAQAFVVAS